MVTFNYPMIPILLRFDGGDAGDSMPAHAWGEVAAGWRGDDTMFGGDGDDTLEGDQGNDLIDGGDDDDRLNGGTGDDTVRGGDGDDYIFENTGEDSLLGGDGDDTILGDENDDALDGGKGDDWLHGDHGDDRLKGGKGNDVLAGGMGDNTLEGGDGEDTFRIANLSGRDLIVDFDELKDHVDITCSHLADFAAVWDRAEDVDDGVLLHLRENGELLIEGVSRDDLQADWFVL